MGYAAAAVAISNFHGVSSLSSEEYMLKVGDIFIANYDTGYDYEKAPENDEPNPNCWAVVISHLDPGFASYGPGSTTRWLRPGTREFAEAMVDLLRRKERATDLLQRLVHARQEVFSQQSSEASERVRKSISREVRQHHFDSTTALQAQQVNWARYGCASGPANSEARRQQCIKPLRYNHAAFRCCKSYTNDKDAWHSWFMNLKQGTNKWQAVRRWAQAEQHSAIRNLISLHQVDICLEKANPCLQKWIGVLRTPIYHIWIYRTGTVCSLFVL